MEKEDNLLDIYKARLELIWAIGCDYDGFNTVDSLKSLVDELVHIAQGSQDEFIKQELLDD